MFFKYNIYRFDSVRKENRQVDPVTIHLVQRLTPKIHEGKDRQGSSSIRSIFPGDTPPKFNSEFLPLRNGGWKTVLSYWETFQG